jgi:hypothetical protein
MRSLRTELRFGSVYLKRSRSTLPPLRPFALISDDEDGLNQRHCLYQASIYGSHVPPAQPAPEFTWAAALVDTEPIGRGGASRLVCIATLISSRHLLASKFCIARYLTSHGRTVASK